MKNKLLIFSGLALIAIFLGLFITIGPALNNNTSDGPKVTDVLNTPGQDATDEERRQHFELAAMLAEEADLLDITGCKADPVVLKLTDQETFGVKNDDIVPHVLRISDEIEFTVEANSTTGLKADFGHGVGLYGYGCDGSTGAIGLFLVTF
ncbi:MAG: hypothetical protein HYS87_00700 [Candidatus Colwellbacteria bacterium]|nr:hypothetical protein [Candidatus Colwellbacteria bacterium]